MKRHSMGLVVTVLAPAGIYASHSWAVVHGQAEASSELRARMAAYERAWNAHDPAAVAAFFTADADMVMGNGPIASGQGEIQAWWASYFAKISKDRSGSFAVTSIRLLTPDVALVNVDSSTGRQAAGGADLPTRLARGTWVMVHRDGEWLIAALRGLPAQGDVRTSPGVDRQ